MFNKEIIVLILMLFNSHLLAQNFRGKFNVQLENEDLYPYYIYKLEQSAILLTPHYNSYDTSELIRLKAMDVYSIEKYLSGDNSGNDRMLKGALFGSLVGYGIGAFIRYNQGGYGNANRKRIGCLVLCRSKDRFVIKGLIATISGMIIGGILANQVERYPIFYSQDKFSKQRKRLKKYQLVH